MLNLFFSAAFQVLVASVLIGTGLPALFALGIRAHAWGVAGSARSAQAWMGRSLGIACYGIVLLIIGVGIMIIVASGFGYRVSFEHIIPAFVRKH